MIELELLGNIAVVRLKRPEKLNALTRVMLDELSAVFARVEGEGSVRALILTGAGERAFCAGTDIEELAGLDTEGARLAALRGQAVCERVENCPVPVIAAVNGIAAGGGCELALACHLRLAATHAKFGLPETRLGIIPGYGGTQRLARIAGKGRALEAMLTGSQISAEEAQHLGIVNRVVAPEELLPAAMSLAGEIARLAPLAIRACLAAVTRGIDLPLAEGLALEVELFTKLFDTEDMREGTRAFLEKRAPVFKGK
ncbi:MAG TPA: enoyl-CoA hydratase-related protein [Pyrinomonadaceae bacterium]|jgi:enoyl-CoA hydratase|nr:enoyl-CoA hydratase-related protein [Pyrinomonadaceae bacterium]